MSNENAAKAIKTAKTAAEPDFSDPDPREYIVRAAPLDLDDPLIPEAWRASAKAQPSNLFDPAVLAAMRQDPELAAELDALREHVQKEFAALIEETIAALPKSAAQATIKPGAAAMSGRRLMLDSRKVELADKSRRELAEAFAYESVLNLANPFWDPTDPATSKETPSALLALLR